jgi:RNA polymerase sigma-70 factor (ECF subfamily)
MSIEDRELRRREFEEVALPLQPTLLRMALAMTRHPADAADLVQETYYKAWRFFSAFRKGSDCRAWLTAILRNAYINRYRRKQRRPTEIEFDEWQDIDPVFRDEHVRIPAPDDENTMGQALSDEVIDALGQLPDHFRDVVILSDVKGLSYQEVADRVGCPIGTVRSRLFRARATLRELLDGYAQEVGVGKDYRDEFPGVDGNVRAEEEAVEAA